MLTTSQARTIVNRGATLLDGVAPNWFKKVDLDTFDLESTSMCVLGQTHRDFQVGLEEIATDALQARIDATVKATKLRFEEYPDVREARLDSEYYGFNAATGENEDFETLSQQWVRVINKRKEAAKAARKGSN